MKAECNRKEYKQQLTDDLEKEAMAFLNYHEGGIVYIGIHKSGEVTNCHQLKLVSDLFIKMM